MKNINDPIPIKYPNHPPAQKLYEAQIKMNRAINLQSKLGYYKKPFLGAKLLGRQHE